jgi:hypothetical protein
MKSLLTVICIAGSIALPGHAAAITFEGVAAPGGLMNVTPAAPYIESG